MFINIYIYIYKYRDIPKKVVAKLRCFVLSSPIYRYLRILCIFNQKGVAKWLFVHHFSV